MQMPPNTREKIMSAYQLLQGATISVDTFEHIHTILKGLHPKLDEKLEICSKALDKLQKLQAGDIITLSAEGLPEDTEEKRKRKKALLFFIHSLKDLNSEIKRIDTEFSQAQKRSNSSYNQLTTWGRIISHAKGPLGIVTLVALVIVGVMTLQTHKAQNYALIIPKPTQIKMSAADPVDSGCTQEGHITSPSSYNKALITFDNQTAQELKVYWIDFQGNRKLYAHVKAHSTYDQATWIGHVWVVTDEADQCIRLQSANSVQQAVVIN
jgi:hypothetical protein